MKNVLFPLLFSGLLWTLQLNAQEGPIQTDGVTRADYHDVIGPIRNFPPMTEAEFREHEKYAKTERNEELKNRLYPFAASALPKGPDAAWQQQQGKSGSRETVLNFAGLTSPYYPPDANGSAGLTHYMQTINCSYAIWDKSGNMVVPATAMNLLFAGVPGAGFNDGDPLILYDDDAGRWLAVEFSISGSPDRMLIAVSQSEDPTGTWDRWSFVMTGMPDYEKFGIWRDGYYMATNTGSGKDVYAFERDAMLAGADSPQMVSFDNPWRPSTIDGFHTIMPLDNDGPLAPAGSPGLFITINDDAISGGSDQLWIYELTVNWANASAATFNRVQQLNVTAFDSNFGNSWENIPQQGTSQKLDAIPMVLMYRAQYRNFGDSQTIVCNHTVDLNASNHAGIRWYELQKTSGLWSVRQQGTYGPDIHHRWMGSIAMNGNHEIALGYSVSSSTLKPSIRYTGQSSAENSLASGVLDISETSIVEGAYSQTGAERWGDYSNMVIDPIDDHTFWYTSQHVGSGDSQKTKIASIVFPGSVLMANFSATPLSGMAPLEVAFSDLSTGAILSWAWDFGDGGTSVLQNPVHTYTNAGIYTVSLTITDSQDTDSEIKTNYIQVSGPNPVADFSGTPTSGTSPLEVSFTDLSINAVTSWTWDFGDGGASVLQNPVYIYQNAGIYTVSLTVSGPDGTDTEIKTDYITVSAAAPVADFTGFPTLGLPPLDVTFTDLSTNEIDTWAWSFGDGGTSVAQHPMHTYLNEGVYTVTLTVSGPGGTDTEIKTEYITIAGPTPVAEFSATPTSGSPPLEVEFTDLSINQIDSWAWDFGDGATSTSQNPMHIYANEGLYTVTLTVIGPDGTDTEIKTDYITVSIPMPVANFSGSPTSGTSPLEVVFTDLTTNDIDTWAWDFGDGTTSATQNPTHTYANEGVYTVSLTVTGPGGTDTEIKTDYITVANPETTADFSATPLSGLKPLLVIFTDLSINATTWAWNFGDGGTSTLQNPVHIYQNSGVYTVSLTVSGSGGSDTKIRTNYITVNEPAPIAAFSGTPLTGEQPLNVQFTNASTGVINTYSWTFGDGGQSTLQNPLHTYTSAGVYTVSLTVNGPGGSDTETKSNYISVTTIAPPVADFVGVPTSGSAPLVVSFTDLSTGNVNSWVWDFGDRFTTDEQNPTHTYGNVGEFTVTLQVAGPGGSVTEIKTDYIVIPTGVDESNSGFIMYPNPANETINLDFGTVKDRKLKLYDLSGQLLRETRSDKMKVEIDISTLKSGLYNLSVIDSDNTETIIRVVKN